MNSRLPAVALVAVAIVVLSNCNRATISTTEPQPAPHATKGGPPPHAPAHGYRRKFQYHYFPDAQVYHAPDRGVWFWIEGDQWKVGAKLPESVVIDAGGGVSVELDSDKPYEFHAETSAAHPGKGKGKSKGKSK